MDFTVSEKMQTILGMMKEFVQKELIPLEPEILTKSFSEIEPVLAEKRKMVKQMELWSPLNPKSYGGMELNLMDSALVYETLRSFISMEPKSKRKNGCDRSSMVRYEAVFR
jgi:alkylation response protein AidB-like acyl-CoA dehydrogenase